MITIGQHAIRTKTITEADIEAFGQASGDRNPLHFDDAYAATTRFGQRIAHGLLTASLISAVLGNDLPGPGSVYLNQTLMFKAPVFIGDIITASVEVTGYQADKRLVTLRTVCAKPDGQIVLEGEAVLIAPKEIAIET